MMKKLSLMACLLTLFFTFSCDNSEVLDDVQKKQNPSEDPSSNANAKSPIAYNTSADTPVKLSRAESFMTWRGQEVNYTIRIKNINGSKTVQVYFSRGGGAWTTVDASLVKAYSNYSVYSYSTYYGSPSQISFVIKYVVNGTTYWDNNDGRNYSLRGGDNQVVGNNVTLLWAESYYVPDSHSPFQRIRGEILVQNICYNKRVGIKFNVPNSIEGWTDLNGTFKQLNGGSGTEVWQFDWPALWLSPTLGWGDRYWQFAVYFENKDAGVYYWENNFNQNYIIPFANTPSPGVNRIQ